MERSDKPYATSHEEALELPGLNTDAVVHHGPVEYTDSEFWNSVGDVTGAFLRLERKGIHTEPHVYIEGRLNAEQLLALYIALKQEDDK